MTIQTHTRHKDFVAQGAAATVPINFPFAKASDLVVVPLDSDGLEGSPLTLNSHYAIGGNGRTLSGVLTEINLEVGADYRIRRSTGVAQNYNPKMGIAGDASAMENQLDDLAMAQIDQSGDLAETNLRALLVPRGAAAPALEIAGLSNGDILVYEDGKLKRLDRERFAGQFYAGGVGGVLTPASGTEGADGALRTDLATAEGGKGAALVGVEGGGSAADVLKAIALSAYQFGATGGDDTTALTAAVAAAVEAGRPLLLGAAHMVTAPIPVTGSLQIIGRDGYSRLSTNDHDHALFDLQADASLRLTNIKAVGEYALLHVSSNFGTVEVDHSHFEGVDGRVNYLVQCADSLTGDWVNIHHNYTRHATAYFGDNVDVLDLDVDDNEFRDTIRHVVRGLPQPDAPSTSAMSPTRLSFQRNIVGGINDNYAGANACRMVQVSAKQTLDVNDNDISDVIPINASTSSIVYWAYGSLTFMRNKIRRVESAGATGERCVSDKADGTEAGNFKHKIRDNSWDQSDVTAARSPGAIYHFYSSGNVDASGDSFTGLRCPAYRYWQSVDLGITTENYSFRNAKVYNHCYPTVVVIQQQCKNVSVEGFEVYSISNPDAITVNGDGTRLRLVDVYLTYANGLDIDNVNIGRNTIFGGTADTVIAHIYLNASATGTIKNWSLRENKIIGAAAGAIRFQNGASVGAGEVIRTTLPTATLFFGTAPTAIRLEGNVPAPAGSLTQDVPSIAAGALSAEYTITATGAAIGDHVTVTPSIDLGADFEITNARVSAANTVKFRLRNLDAANAKDPASATYYATVARRGA